MKKNKEKLEYRAMEDKDLSKIRQKIAKDINLSEEREANLGKLLSEIDILKNKLAKEFTKWFHSFLEEEFIIKRQDNLVQANGLLRLGMPTFIATIWNSALFEFWMHMTIDKSMEEADKHMEELRKTMNKISNETFKKEFRKTYSKGPESG